MHDLVIRHGTVVDGSGAPAREGDVAIEDDRIVTVGEVSAAGRREIDARGKLVIPGLVDCHTHYAAQATWDSLLTPSSWHGVTTVVMGNCGVGFAPAAPDRHDWLIALMEGVEEIPGAAMVEGIEWAWESFPEYLDALERRPRALDVATQVPHGAVRAYVMGERGAKNEEATPEDIARMAAIVREGVAAGALGFSTSRTLIHKASDGEWVPGTFASEAEVLGIGRVLGELGAGVFQMTSNHHGMDGEFPWMKRLAAETGQPVTFNLVQTDEAPELWKKMLRLVDDAAAEGIRVRPSVAGRPAGVLMGWQTTINPFSFCPAYQLNMLLPLEERLVKLRDPAVREKVVADEPPSIGSFLDFITRTFERMFPLGDPPEYEPPPERSVAAQARARGIPPAELAYEILNGNGGSGLLYFPLFNYHDGDMDPIRVMLSHPQASISLGDGGAHVGSICDASIPTFLLTHWVRDRTRGPRLPLELVVQRHSRGTAELYGLRDRGLLAVGMKADVNVLDFDGLTLHAPEIVFDLPAGGKRLVQRASGWEHTIVSGEVTFESGEPTGALPGRVVRGAPPDPRR